MCQDLAKRRFSRHRENLCETNDAALEGRSARAAKNYMRKTAYLAFLSDGDEAAKTFRLSLEKLCENRTRRT